MKTLVAVLALCVGASAAGAHGLQHSLSRGDAVVVTITHEDGLPFAFESVEVFPPGESVPFVSGQTDALGRVVFLPDQDGDWRIRAFSEDGHGIDVTVSTRGSATDSTARPGRLSRIVLGVSILFGIFGLVALFFRRRP